LRHQQLGAATLGQSRRAFRPQVRACGRNVEKEQIDIADLQEVVDEPVSAR
jgi:hypothetical protein